MVFHEALLMSGKVYCDSGIDFVIVEQTQIKIWINYTDGCYKTFTSINYNFQFSCTL